MNIVINKGLEQKIKITHKNSNVIRNIEYLK